MGPYQARIIIIIILWKLPHTKWAYKSIISRFTNWIQSLSLFTRWIKWLHSVKGSKPKQLLLWCGDTCYYKYSSPGPIQSIYLWNWNKERVAGEIKELWRRVRVSLKVFVSICFGIHVEEWVYVLSTLSIRFSFLFLWKVFCFCESYIYVLYCVCGCFFWLATLWIWRTREYVMLF